MTILFGVLLLLVVLITVTTGEAFGKSIGTIIGFMFLACLAMLVVIPIMLVVIPVVMSVVIPLFLIGGLLFTVHCALKSPGPRPLP